MDLINHKVNRAFKGTKRDEGLGSLTFGPGTCSWRKEFVRFADFLRAKTEFRDVRVRVGSLSFVFGGRIIPMINRRNFRGEVSD